MNIRQLFDEYFIRGNREVERMPMIEYAPYWDLTLKAWHEQGIDPQMPPDRVQQYMGLDPLWYTSVDPAGEGFPYSEINGGAVINSEDDYEKLLPHMYPQKPIEKVMDLVMSHKEESDNGQFMFELNLNGFFWWPRTILGIENHLFSFYDEPELYHRICKDLLKYNIRVVKEFLQYASPAFIILGEDMSYNHGSMISKEIWDEFLRPYYKVFLAEMKKLNQTVIFDSDGRIDDIVDWVIESGFDGILPLERMAGVDIDKLTQKYPNFKFIGGFDKTVMKFGEAAMRKEFERILPSIKRGNYLPCVDHQTPPDVSVENYKIYIKLFHEYALKAVEK